MSLCTALLNTGTGHIIEKTYRAGAAVETAIKKRLGDALEGQDLMFALMKGKPRDWAIAAPAKVITHIRRPTFGWVLSTAFHALALVFLLIAIATMV
jgi:hypothetical protein